MTEQFCRVGAGRQVCYRTDGDPSGTPLLLVAGLTPDLTSWPRAMVDGLVAQRFYVIRFDNRDVGRTTPAAHRRRACYAARCVAPAGTATTWPIWLATPSRCLTTSASRRPTSSECRWAA
jgi:pimeloyl-ACP methyl ester carboxylesterase